jgi:hypothetical protein
MEECKIRKRQAEEYFGNCYVEKAKKSTQIIQH